MMHYHLLTKGIKTQFTYLYLLFNYFAMKKNEIQGSPLHQFIDRFQKENSVKKAICSKIDSITDSISIKD